VVIMAAGLGTRMKSETVKVLHPIAGRPMIHYPVRSALDLGPEKVVLVLGHQRARVEAYIAAAFPDAPIEGVLQAEQLGTAHAVLCAREALADFEGDVFILSGDVPTLPTDTIRRLDEISGDAAVGVIGMRLDDPRAYGRFVRDEAGAVCRIVEARDCTPQEVCIQEVNAGIYRADARFLFDTLAGVGTDNAQGEYYLTDLVQAAAQGGRGVAALVLDGATAEEASGVNDRLDLAAAEARMQRRLRRSLMTDGVTLIDPARVTLHDGVEVGPDTVIEPDVSLLGSTRIGSRCHLEQGARLVDTVVGDGVVIKGWSHLDQTTVADDCQVGPFARLRVGTRLSIGVKIGNFVETKKAELGPGAKASHLSYIGDASVGAGANIGAGTITCNYDGVRKFRTKIGAGAFIGSDTQLVAPVTVGDGAYVGAGSTVTEDVPPNALALSRTPQQNLAGWAERRRARDAAERKD
jgi:bifunctional UDP-N-acetylglucosamine pyrophosphorylase/glucosamine-1-phosphate N-acetyltransferase